MATLLNQLPVSLGAVGAMIVLFMEITRGLSTDKKTPAAAPTSTVPIPAPRLESETADDSGYVT
jgi:hypothetical protein